MLKRDVTQNRRPAYEWQEFQIEDFETSEVDEAGNPIPGTGDIYPFRLRGLDELQRDAMLEFADQLVVRHITGNFNDPRSNTVKNQPDILALVEDEQGVPQPVEVSREALTRMARIERMQGVKRDVFDDEPRQEAYTAKDLAIIALTARSVWIQLKSIVNSVQSESGKKKARASAGTSLSPALKLAEAI